MSPRSIDRELTGDFALMEPRASKRACGIAAAAVDERGAMQKRTELAVLLDLVAAAERSVLLEVGALAGGTTWALRQMMADPFVVTVDNLHLGLDVDADVADVRVVGDSSRYETVRAVQQALRGRLVDVLLIDGDHGYLAVKDDYQWYSPLVAPGGLIVFHDVAVPHEFSDVHNVVAFWNEIRVNRRHMTIFFPLDTPWATEVDWGGFGVLVA